MNTFDQFSRHLAKEQPEEFIRWVFPRLFAGLRFARWHDAQNAPRPGETERRCDTIAELIDAEGTSPPWCLVIEFFSPVPIRTPPIGRSNTSAAIAVSFGTARKSEIAIRSRRHWSSSPARRRLGWI